MDSAELLTKAIERAGSEAKLAEAAGCSQPAINKAKRTGSISADMALGLEKATGINRHYWRPDYWPEVVKTAAAQPDRLAP